MGKASYWLMAVIVSYPQRRALDTLRRWLGVKMANVFVVHNTSIFLFSFFLLIIITVAFRLPVLYFYLLYAFETLNTLSELDI